MATKSKKEMAKVRRELNEKRCEAAKVELLTKSFYQTIRKQLSATELDYFTKTWVETIMQFNNDLLPTEEAELREMILLEILQNRMMSETYILNMRKDRLEIELTKLKGLPPDRDTTKAAASIRADMESVISRARDNMKQYKDLGDRLNKMREALNASRKNRSDSLQSAKQSFGQWIALIQDYEIKKRVSHEMEIMRMAMEKEQDRLGSPYKFANKQTDLPILSPETVEGKDVDIDE